MKHILLAAFLICYSLSNAQTYTPLNDMVVPYCDQMQIQTQTWTTTEEVRENIGTDCSPEYRWVVQDVVHKQQYVTVQGKAIPYKRAYMEDYFKNDREAYKYFKRSYRNGKSSTFFSITSGVTFGAGLIYAITLIDWPEGGGSSDSDYDDDDDWDDDDWGYNCLKGAPIVGMQLRNGEDDPITTTTTTTTTTHTTQQEKKKDINVEGIVLGSLFTTGVATLVLAIQKHKAKKKNMDKAFDIYNSNVSTCALLKPDFKVGVTNLRQGNPRVTLGLTWSF